MNCAKCNIKLWFLSNYGSSAYPLCFDCQIIEKEKSEKDDDSNSLSIEIKQELPVHKQEDQNNIESTTIADNKNEDDFEEYSGKFINCRICNSILADSDENYGSKEQPLCKDCIALAKFNSNRIIITKSMNIAFLLISYCLGIGSFLVFIKSGSIWPDKIFSPVSGLLFGSAMGTLGGIISLILLCKLKQKPIKGFLILSIAINSLMPVLFFVLMIKNS